MNLCLQAGLTVNASAVTTLQTLLTSYYDGKDGRSFFHYFLMDLYTHIKTCETQTGRKLLPALKPLFQLTSTGWIFSLSMEKASSIIEVLKLQTGKMQIELTGWTDEESKLRSFLECLPSISLLR